MLRIVFLFLFYSFTFYGIAFAGGTPSTVACGVSQACPDGYACTGATGDASSGVCVQNGVASILCKLNDYIVNKVGKIFLVFAVVMVGIAFFLGKISWGMIISVIIGAGMIFGGQSIVQKMANTNSTGFCSTSDAVAACSYTGDIVSTQSGVTNLTVTSSPNGTPCTEATCFQATCNYASIDTTNNNNCNVITGASGFYPMSYIQDSNNKLCGGSQTNNCTMVSRPDQYDVFKCTNTCTNTTFYVEAKKGFFKNCSDYMQRNGN
jgi:type IV secretory pathway VirB2 component (pilin)